MKVKSIQLNDDEMPQSLIVELSIREALFIGLAIGGNNDADANAIIPGGYVENGSIYSGLVGGLFNRYWDSGIDGANGEIS